MPPPESLDAGRYAVTGVLGEGSQGTTYAATDGQTGRAVAIKRFDVRGARSWKDVELAEREIRVLASIDHPLVPRYVAHFEQDGALYLVMERVEGETLEAIRKREGPLPEAEVRRFLACADRALTYLHGRGSPVVHRDIKPGNVVRRPDGSYVLVDFGAVSESLVKRGASTIVGTVGYMAPEQIQGRSLPSSDVYAVGATAIAALTGREPETLPHRGLAIDVRDAVGNGAGPELVASLERMLEPDPDRRAPSLATALDVATMPAPSRPPPALRVEEVSGRPVRTSEDRAVKSFIGLMWALWGLGWILVPMVFGKVMGIPEAIPIVMFGWMAVIFIVSWHKGAVLRGVVRMWREEGQRPVHHRVALDEGDGPRVRVRTTDVTKKEHEQALAETQVDSTSERSDRRRVVR
jgi:serine/threonine protein kinase